jgi:hypothetical protein
VFSICLYTLAAKDSTIRPTGDTAGSACHTITVKKITSSHQLNEYIVEMFANFALLTYNLVTNDGLDGLHAALQDRRSLANMLHLNLSLSYHV